MPFAPENRFATHCRAFASLSCALLNRDFQTPQDGWYQIVPIGEFKNIGEVDGKEAEIVQVLDHAAIDSLANNFSGELLIDFDHFSHDLAQPSRAAGWITAAEPRDDGLYAQIRFSNAGESDVKGGVYRYISPEFDQAIKIKGNRWRPVHLSGAGLTNKPNLTTLKPLSNRESAGSGNQNTNTKTMDYKTILLKVLGLPDTATDEDIQKATDKLGDNTAPDMAQEVETMNRELKTVRETLADADLVNLKLDDDAKATVREALIENRAKGLKIVDALRKSQPQDTSAKATLFNRANAKPPKTGDNLAGENKAEEARAARISNRAHEIVNTQHVGFGVAWGMAEAETPTADSK